MKRIFLAPTSFQFIGTYSDIIRPDQQMRCAINIHHLKGFGVARYAQSGLSLR
jgi:hypothetical protein